MLSGQIKLFITILFILFHLSIYINYQKICLYLNLAFLPKKTYKDLENN